MTCDGVDYKPQKSVYVETKDMTKWREWRARAADGLRHARRRLQQFKTNHPYLFRAGVAFGAAALLGLILVVGVLASVRLGAFGGMPTRAELQAIRNPVASEVYDVNGVLLGRYYLENRSEVRYDELPGHLPHALMAIEDARFLKHHGIDWQAWGRVFYKTILRDEESAGGGSTITQQLAKNLFPRRDHGYGEKTDLVINKLREVVIAHRLENMYSKAEIMEMYLNTVPFSDNTFGVRTAAQRFFQKEPKELTPEESATLVAMLKATSIYNPKTNPRLSLERRNLVLALMEQQGYLEAAAADSLKETEVCLNYLRLDNNAGLATYFREHLRLELAQMLQNVRRPDGGSYNIYTDGLRIYTTIDAQLQKYAEEAVQTHMAELQQVFEKHLRGRTPWETEEGLLMSMYQSPLYRELQAEGLSREEIDSVFNTPREMIMRNRDGSAVAQKITPLDSLRYYLSFLNAGFLVADHQNDGAVKAWVGGIDHRFFKYDHVKSRRQTGSAFKPVLYATAIKSGMKPCQFISNTLRTYHEYDDWQPRNSDNSYGGRYSLHGGLTKSVNTVAAQVIMRTQPEPVVQLAHDLGIKSEVPPYPSIALGTVEATLWEMVNVYSTFGNDGVRPNMHYLLRIETPDGRTIYRHRNDEGGGKRALAEDHAVMMRLMLQKVVEDGTGRRLRFRYNIKGDIAGKTGTTQNHSDGWFLGFTPRLAAGAWVGGESTAVRFRDLSLGQGANMALPILGEFLKKVYSDPNYREWVEEEFAKPSEEVKEALDCPAYINEYYYTMPRTAPAEYKPATVRAVSFPVRARAVLPSGGNE